MSQKKTIVVVSDSHGNYDALRHAVEDNPDLSALLFLGDGYHDFEKLEREFPAIPMMGVPGNCDYDCDEPFTKIYHIAGKKLMLTHGHNYQVKLTMDYLLAIARKHEAAAALYGHTHWSNVGQERDGLWRVNPGSISYSKRYALITIDGDEVTAELRQLSEPKKEE